MEKYLKIIFLISILIISALLTLGMLTTGHNWGGDFAQYIMQAKSIVESSVLEFVTEASPSAVGPAVYPWGFPFMLAPFYAFLGFDIFALKMPGFICFFLFLIVLWSGFSQYHTYFWRIMLVSLFAFNPVFLYFINSILTDIPFMLVSTLCVLFMGRLLIAKRQFVSPFLDQVLLGTLIASAYFIRTNGVLLLVTLAITQIISSRGFVLKLFSKRFKKAFLMPRTIFSQLLLLLLPYLSFMVLLFAWSIFLPEGGLSHVGYLDGVSLSSIINNIEYYVKLPANFFSLSFPGPRRYVLYGASIPLFIAGMMGRYRRDYHIIAYIGLTLLTYILWPSLQGLRFIYPILPFYMSFVLSTTERHINNYNTTPDRLLRNVIAKAPVIAVILLFTFTSVNQVYKNINGNRVAQRGPYTEESLEMFAYIKNNTEPVDTIMFFKPRVMKMMTHRNSFRIDAQKLHRVDYLVLYHYQYVPITYDLERLLSTDSVREIYYNQNFIVYKIDGQCETLAKCF